MPGIVGKISLMDNAQIFKISEQVYSKLLHFPEHKAFNVYNSDAEDILLIDPRLDMNICGFSKVNDIIVSYYGQFYNQEFNEASNGQMIAEKIAQLFFEKGSNVANYLDGTFILYIKDKNCSYIINDHYASRPLFYALQNNILYFAPEIKYFKYLPEFNHVTDKTSIIDLLVNGHMLNSKTYYTNVKSMEPGSILVVNRFIEERKYYKFSFNPEYEGDEHEYIKNLSQLLLKSVEKRYNSNSFVVPISGGYDSRGILGCLREMTDKPIKTVSWGVNESDINSDAYIGRKIARFMNTEHYFLKRTFENFDNDCHEMLKLTDGLNDDAVFHHSELNIMKKIRNDLCCEHLIRGDECFGFGDIARSDQEALSRVGIYSLLDFPAIKNLINEDCLSDFIQASNQNIQNILNSTDLTDYADRKDFFYFHQRLINYLNRSSYYKMCILELSNPWLDKDILSFLCKIPRKYRYNKILYKKTVSYMFPDLYNIPFAKKHSLEDWNTLIKNDKSLSFKINTKLKKSIALEAIININNLQQLLDSFYNNSQFSHNSLKSIILKYGKYFASHIPLLYSYAKKHFMKYNIGRDIEYSKLIMRLYLISLLISKMRFKL